MDMTERGWERTTFSRNRERRLEHDVAAEFFYAVVEQAPACPSHQLGALHRRWYVDRRLGLAQELCGDM